MRLLAINSIGCLICLLLTGCLKDLCYDHNHTANVSLELDYHLDWRTHTDVVIDPSWHLNYDAIIPLKPSGVRVMTYPHYNAQSMREYNLDPDGERITIPSGHHDVLMYNNDSEYIIIEGQNLATYATTRQITRGSYNTRYPDETTVNAPDRLFSAYLPDLEIEEQVASKPNEQAKIVKYIQATLSPLVFTYVVRCEFDAGLDLVSGARGALSGMAEGVQLVDGSTPNNKGVTLFFDCEKTLYGFEAITGSFGMPGVTFDDIDPVVAQIVSKNTVILDANHHNKSIQIAYEGTHRLNVELKLRNGKQKMYEFDVTDQLRQQPRGGVIVAKGLEVTEEEGKPNEGEGGGFDTEVGDWEENVDIIIPLL